VIGVSVQKLALLLLRGYKLIVSPWLPPSCRFVPSCSEYAVEAIETYGACEGARRALVRLLCCHPLHRGGYDPVK